MIPIITRYHGFCRVCNGEVGAGISVWWDPGSGVIHEGCYGRIIDRRSVEGHIVRQACTKLDINPREKYAYSIDESKKRINEARMKMGWPDEYN